MNHMLLLNKNNKNLIQAVALLPALLYYVTRWYVKHLSSYICKLIPISYNYLTKNMGAPDHFNVKFTNETIVKATNPHCYSNIVTLSNIDRLVIGIPLSIFYLYEKLKTGDFSLILKTMKRSLSETLNHFIPFSGQFSTNSTGETEILCNNRGVKLLEASVDIALSKLYLYNQNKSIRKIISFPKDHREFVLHVQITSFTCGGILISCIFDHSLADANAFTKFLSAWCAVACTNKCLTVYNFDRSVLEPRSPPIYNQQLIDHNYSSYTVSDGIKMPHNCATERHLYLVRESSLRMLKASCKKTRTVALSAYLWKLMAKTCNESGTICRMGWVVDGRKRMDINSEKELNNFIGNVVLMSTGECTIGKLKEESLEYVAGIASEAINEVANNESFVDCIDWVESNRSKIILPNIIIGDDKPSMVISSCHNMPVMEMDFGFGLPEVGMFCSASDKLGAGYVNFVSRGRDWLVSAMITGSLATELEIDPEHVFVPVTSLGGLEVPSKTMNSCVSCALHTAM